MKTPLLFLVSLALLGACAPLKNVMGTGCQENKQFKKTYFHHLALIEAWALKPGKASLTVNQDSINDAILKSLGFLSKYSHVSMEKLANYSFGYPDQATYEADKAGWLKWYEANKCANLH